MVLGLDFDNTIINYDRLFYKIALEKELIPSSLPKEKNAVRDFLREKDIENEWTIIQGEVYGHRINEAFIFDGVIDILKKLRLKNIPIKIISHKTKYPYLGTKKNLHTAAKNWLKLNHFFDIDGLNFKENQVYFEITKSKKIDRIISSGCTHYVDDLPEILDMIPKKINKILFSPKPIKSFNNNWSIINSWKDLPKVII